MNFLKGSLFRRNTEPEELEPMEDGNSSQNRKAFGSPEEKYGAAPL